MTEFDQIERLAEALERQADALETLARESEFQNAVLMEVAKSNHQIAVNSLDIGEGDPDERSHYVPNYRSLLSNVQDHETTREERRDSLL